VVVKTGGSQLGGGRRAWTDHRPQSAALATDRPDLESAFMPDLLGAACTPCSRASNELEMVVEGHAHRHDVRPSEAGVWSGEDFSI